MNTTSPSQDYSSIAKLLHWLMAILIIAAFILGSQAADIEGITPTKIKFINWHKWLGVTIFGLAGLRLLWRMFNTPPANPAGMPVWQAKASSATHMIFYFLFFALPVTGYFYSLASGYPIVYLGLFKLPVLIEKNKELADQLIEVHELFANGLLALFIVHVAAALKHHFIDRDNVLTRMLPKFK
ncbi:cytochrome b [Ampullimonas aquatilis]|uniref:cytochrome b n=1 Tax=Ampullimonas aquatilis TaxID=1341549 RepID=UPI003C73C699